jgi:integrase
MKAKRLDWDKLNTFSRDLIDSNIYADLKDDVKRNNLMLGIYIQIGLRTGLRAGDILNLKKSNFCFKENLIFGKTQKTDAEYKFALPGWLLRIIQKVEYGNNGKQVYLFFNPKYSSVYSKTWVNNRLQKSFPGRGVSSHSIRKSAGFKIALHFGVNGASNFLTHSSLQHTKSYIGFDVEETMDLQKSVMLD